MFCEKCGKNIAEESVFCEFCGNKIGSKKEEKQEIIAETPKKIDKKEAAILNKTLKQIADHLEFLGYKIEKLEMPNDRELIAARHEIHNNYLFHEVLAGVTLFQVSLSTGKKKDKKMDEVVNIANKNFLISRFYFDVEDDLVVLRIEAVYMGDYSKEAFARFEEQFKREQSQLIQFEEFKIFLNN